MVAGPGITCHDDGKENKPDLVHSSRMYDKAGKPLATAKAIGKANDKHKTMKAEGQRDEGPAK
jgi:hypothetical protein